MSGASVKSLGIVAGGGELPQALADRCKEQGIHMHIVGLKNYADEALANIVIPIGSAGKIFKAFHAQGISDLVLIGKLGRPKILDLRPDFKTLSFFGRLGAKAFNGQLGDDGLLKALRDELEIDGFTLHGVHKFLPELLAEEGALSRLEPTSTNMRGGILVKTCKPQQDRDLDMPTIGPRTIQAAHENGLSGIAVQASETLIADRAETIKLADQYGLFLIGVSL